ncbi:MAG: NADH-quinone oxidoreductase subunit NuoE [Desulfovermiculus sp.]
MAQELEKKEAEALEKMASLLEEGAYRRRDLIPLLQVVQVRLGYIPKEAIGLLAEHLRLSRSQVFGVASFYNQFRFNPPGKHDIKVCMGTACHVRGGDIILENFERKLGIEEGQTTQDREFSLDRVACVGCCALAPVAIVGNEVYGYMAPSKIEGMFTKIETNEQIQDRQKDGQHCS